MKRKNINIILKKTIISCDNSTELKLLRNYFNTKVLPYEDFTSGIDPEVKEVLKSLLLPNDSNRTSEVFSENFKVLICEMEDVIKNNIKADYEENLKEIRFMLLDDSFYDKDLFLKIIKLCEIKMRHLQEEPINLIPFMRNLLDPLYSRVKFDFIEGKEIVLIPKDFTKTFEYLNEVFSAFLESFKTSDFKDSSEYGKLVITCIQFLGEVEDAYNKVLEIN